MAGTASGLRARLALIIVLALLPSAGLVSYDAWQLREEAVAAAAEQVLTRTVQIASEGGGLLTGARYLLTSIATFPSVHEQDGQECTRVIKRIHGDFPEYNVLAVADMKGDVFCSSIDLPGPINVMNRAWFTRARESGRFSVGDYVSGLVTGRGVVHFSMPVHTDMGRISAVAMVGYDVVRLADVFVGLDLPPDARLALIDRRGIIVYRTPDPEKEQGRIVDDAALLETIAARHRGVVEIASFDGSRRIVGFSPLGGEGSLHLTISRAKDVVVAPASRLFLVNVVVLLLLVAAGFAAAATGADALVLAGIRRLIDATNQLARGEFATRVATTTGAREVRRLGQAFNLMADALEEKHRELAESNRQLQEKTEELASLLHAAPLAVFALDNKAVVRLWNPAAARMFGYSAAEVVGHAYPLVPPQEWTEFRRQFERAMDEGRLDGFEAVRRRRDGSDIVTRIFSAPLHDAGGRQWGAIYVVEDITERRRMQEALAASEERLRLALDLGEVGTFDWNLRTGEITWSERHYRLFGLDPADGPLGYAACRDGIHPEDRAAAEEAVARSRERHEPYDHQYRIVWPDGTVRWVAARGSFLYDEVGKAQRLLGVVTDITARKTEEERMHRFAEELERQVARRTVELEEVNAELNSFAYTVSHDLRAPLRAMQGFAQALLEDYGNRLDATGRDYAGRVIGAAQRMDELIRDLLAYSRLIRSDISLKNVDLRPVIDEAMAQLADDLARARAAVSVAPDLPAVRAERNILRQAVANLLSNALKFVAPGRQPEVSLRVERGAGKVRLWVEDNGIGIPAEHQERIFRVFERLHGIETYPGTGIGLAIVRKAAERMGGGAGVVSEPGCGSRFWIELGEGEPP